ncbi:MAG: hypothetical protein ABI693_12980 [Bryobacteraceae bacterium]
MHRRSEYPDQRTAFIKQAAVEMSVKEEVIRQDLGQVLLKLEELQDQQIQKTLEPKQSEAASATRTAPPRSTC